MNKQMHEGAYQANANGYGYTFFVYGNIIWVYFSGTITSEIRVDYGSAICISFNVEC